MPSQKVSPEEGASFPPLPTHLTKPRANARASQQFSLPASARQKWPATIVCRAALAALFSQYTRASDVAFDVLDEQGSPSKAQHSTDNAPASGIRTCNVHLDPHQSRSDLMRVIEGDERAPDARHMDSAETKIKSQTVLAVTNFRSQQNTFSPDLFESCTDRALLLECQETDESISIFAWHDPNVIDGRQIHRFLRQLGSLLEQLEDSVVDQTVKDLDPMTKEDLEEIRGWNSAAPPIATDCIHDLITQRANSSPQDTAVSAWDGDITYADLDDLSFRLALHIYSLDLGAESIIPLCFEKSKWTVISMLAVLKAGAAYALVDPSLPAGRIEAICKRISPKVALVSEGQRHIMSPFVSQHITVDDNLLHSLLVAEHASLPEVKPNSLAYIIFTSGSTGEPKGSMVEHRGVSSYASVFGPAFKLDQNTRALQFASYAYAVCATEILGTLLTGGCVCIPSEHDRVNNITEYIRNNAVNHAILTPSFIGSIQPESVPSLKTLLLAGEPMKPEMKDIWADRVQLMNAHGQSECLFDGLCTITTDTPDVRVLGRGSGTRLWLIEPGNKERLVPVGCPGELMMENDAVARGYLGMPELTATKFLTTPPSWYPQKCDPLDGARFYQSGDLAYYQSDGQIVTLGREDSQVKIRGQRVELGEVEFQLRRVTPPESTPMVELVTLSGSAQRKMLVAFLITPPDADESGQSSDAEFGALIMDHATATRFTAQMEKQVGRHAIPSYYVSLKKFPKTATGKTDRKGLRILGAELLEAKNGDSASQPEAGRPHEGREKAMAELWERSMSVKPGSIGMQDDFFDLGGDSIIAIQMVNRARASGLSLNVEDLLQNPVLADSAKLLDEDVASRSAESRPTQQEMIPTQPRDVYEAELSFAQRGLWFLEQLNPGTPAYHVSIAGRLRGPLRIDALRAALHALEERHETLRTTFKERNGTTVQVINPCRSPKDILTLIELPQDVDVGEELRRQQRAAFDFKSTPPWRVALLQLGAEDHILSIVMHHIISDGWSDDVLRRNLTTFYSAAVAGRDPLVQLEPLPIQYRDFAVWQQSVEQQNEQQRQLQYWTEQLADSAPAELLVDKRRPALPSGVAGILETTIDGNLYQRLQQFCKTHQTTLYVVLLAAFRAAHYRLTGAEDANIGTPNAGRNRTEVEGIVGFFSNTQCMRITIEGESFVELVQQVKATVTAALAHQDVPFERIVSEVLPGSRDASRNPLVQLMFALHSQPNLGEIHLEGLSGEALPGTESTRFDAEFHLIRRKDEIRGNVLYAQELFELKTIQNVVDTFKEVLRRGLEEPEVPISSMRLTDGIAELRSRDMLDIARAEYPRDSSIVDVFRERVVASPTAIAVRDPSTQLSYVELDRQSEILALWLRRRNLAAEAWVGVLASRSCQTIVAFLGILKANLAYVPLDVEAPSNRIEGILSSFEGQRLVLLGDETQAPEFPLEGLECVQLSKALQQSDQERPLDAGPQPSATSLAYVMFTSGSTGKPKGVMIDHMGVVRLVKQTNVLSQLPEKLTVAHLFNIAFDLSVWEVYTALLNGGTVVCIDSAAKTDPKALAEVFAREKIQAAMLPPVLLKACLASAPDMLKGLAAFYNGADRFDSHDARETRKLVPGRVVNAYGPTENSALSTIYDVQKDDSLINDVPIGKAVSNSGAYVMDANQKLVSVGIMGELVVTGDGVARGYTDSSLDRDRFVEIEVEGQRFKAYRTGDRVRYRPTDCQIEFFGRLDNQVKIRGFRIEMAEVEHAMLQQDEVNDAAVVVHQREGEEPDLIGFITAQDDAGGREEETIGQVDSWGKQFDNKFYEGIENIDRSIVGSDFLGWTSMYDGNKIDRNEMKEWLDESMRTMLDGRPAGRVLEIGTGTGMVLLNLGDGLESYIGNDPSKPAINFISEKIQDTPDLANKVELHIGDALDISRIDSKGSELVVVNSVVQYFPSPEYLSEVIQAVSQLSHVKRLFFGDVRSHALNRQFLASRALFKLGENASKTDIRREMARMEDREEELLVSPAFFTRLQAQLPDLIEHVEVLPKVMRATNELSSYRYAVVIHFKHSSEQAQEIRSVDKQDWVDFSARDMDRVALKKLLQDSGNASVVAVSNIPYSKTIQERHIVAALDEEEDSDQSDKAWVVKAKESAERCAALSPIDLAEQAKEAGFRMELSWSRQASQQGGVDAIFHRYEPAREGARVKFRFPIDDDDRSLSNRPLQGQRNMQIERRVRKALQSELPSYMIPRRVIVLDKMPVNDNGKADRKQLAKQAQSAAVFKTTTARVPPQNDEERALCEEFSNVLGVDVNPSDNFFDLGGHSLMAMRLLPRVSERLGWHILLRDLYQNSTPRELYNTATSSSSTQSQWPSYMEHHFRGPNPKATLILIHGFWGQGRIFAGLPPLLTENLDIIILHDPFFGKDAGPRTLDQWSHFYLQELSKRLPQTSKVILGGYSFGAFTALKMGSMWKDWFQGEDLMSLFLLDPAVWQSVQMKDLTQEFIDEKVNYGLRLFGEEQRDYVMEHFKKFGPLMESPRENPEYKRDGLHIASKEVAEMGSLEWYGKNYPSLQQRCIESTHHGLFEWEPAMKQVAQAINEHCAGIWSRKEMENGEQ